MIGMIHPTKLQSLESIVWVTYLKDSEMHIGYLMVDDLLTSIYVYKKLRIFFSQNNDNEKNTGE